MNSLEERRKRRLYNMFKRQEDMARYEQDKNSLMDNGKMAYKISGNVNQIGKSVNQIGKTLNKPKLANAGSKIQNISGQPMLNNLKAKIAGKLGLGSGTASAGTAGASMAGGAGAGTGAIAEGIASAVPSATTTAGTLASGAGAGTAGLAGAGATTAGTASSALGSSALGSSLLSATGGAGATAGATAGSSALTGALTSATSAGATAGAGAGMGAGATMAGLAGPIGAALLAGYAIYNMVKSAKAKKNFKAIAKEEKNLANFNQEVAQDKAETQNNFVQGAQNNLAQLDNETQAQLDPTGSMNEDIQEAQNQGYVGQLPTLGAEAPMAQPTPSFTPPVAQQDVIEGGAPTGFATGVEEDKPGFVSRLMGLIKPDEEEGVAGNLPTLGGGQPSWDENTLNAMDKARGLGLGQDVVDGVAQGLNGGNKDVAGIVDEFGIRKPSTEEEIALAREGKFNTPTMPEATEEVAEEPSLKDRIKNRFVSGVKDFKAGFDDNVSTSLAEGDLLNKIVGEEGVPTSGGDAIKKGIMNRLGEFAGTAVRTAGNPAVQGLIATGISKAQGNDWGKSIETGLDYAQKRQVADHYYKALNPEAKFTPLFSGLGAEDYKAHTMNEYRDAMIENARLKAEAQLDKTNPTLEDWARSMRMYGGWTEDQYNSFIASPEYLANPKARINNEVQKGLVAQQNADTNSRKAEDLNAHYQRMDALKAQANQIDAQYKQGMLSKYERDQQLKVIDQQLKATEVQIKLAEENRKQYVTGQEYKGYTPNNNILTGNITGNTTGKTVTVRAGGQTRNIPADKLEAFLQKAEANKIKVEVL